jgi:hypothetical protein
MLSAGLASGKIASAASCKDSLEVRQKKLLRHLSAEIAPGLWRDFVPHFYHRFEVISVLHENLAIPRLIVMRCHLRNLGRCISVHGDLLEFMHQFSAFVLHAAHRKISFRIYITRPQPAVTISVWPNGCLCQAVRAPGSNVTLAPAARAERWLGTKDRCAPCR